jgi:hypothetical protein
LIEEQQWEHAWSVISNMKGLAKLRVTLYDGGRFGIPEAGLLRPLMNIKVEDFVVRLSWSSENVRDPVVDAPFALRRL